MVRQEDENPTVGGCDLGRMKTESWRETRVNKEAGKSSLLQNISTDWVGMKAKVGTAVFMNI